MKLKLTGRDRYILEVWSDNVIHGGHWGDGDVVFPDEANLLEKIRKSASLEEIELGRRDLEVMLVWADSSHETPEEDILRSRLQAALREA